METIDLLISFMIVLFLLFGFGLFWELLTKIYKKLSKKIKEI